MMMCIITQALWITSHNKSTTQTGTYLTPPPISAELVHTAANGRARDARAQPFEGAVLVRTRESMDQSAAEFRWEETVRREKNSKMSAWKSV